MDEHELTQELQRFATRFTDRIAQATDVLERSPDRRVREEVMRKTLGYVSSAIEIAAGPFAEIDLLDMIVFVHLCRKVLERYWIPTLYGEDGRELADAFAKSEAELAEIAQRSVGAARADHVESLVDEWLADNPTQVRVEGIRLADFASGAARATSDRMLEARGILSSVKTATEVANQAMMLVERGLFLLHRMPSVLRFEARLAAHEMLGDSIAQMARGPDSPLAQLEHRARRLAKSGALAAGIAAFAGLVTLRIMRRRR